MDFVVASDRDFWRWQSPAGTLAEQPQIATMKEKPSHHPKREIRAHQTRFGGTEERSIKYESDPRTVNFISLLPLIQKEPGNGRDIIGKISMPAFHFAFTTSLEMKLLWLSTWCPIGVILVSMDRGHIGIHYDWRDLKVNDQFLSYSSVFSMSRKGPFGVSSGFFRTRGKGEGETDEYMIFGRIGATELFIRIFYLGFGEEHVNPHEHSTFPDVACLPKTEKSGNHRLRSMIGEDTIVLGILIGTAKEDNGEDGNFASRGGS
ncbi:hypothetical protein F2Q70_00031621 [Brassica cretica]|uniref:Uncharacterized protein n=1 Tax=Brassica cretica TaxID=69181 RepID=A0A8S9FFC3_BRACR|nr:hypothetical protein F2Q70_00031621 [Brassica cretica]